MKKLSLAFLLIIATQATAAPLNESALNASVSRVFHPLLMQLTGMYAEDTPHVSGHFGSLVLAVRNDSGSVLAGTTGDYIPFTTDNTGALRVTGGAGGGLTDAELRATPVPVSGTVTVTDGAGALNAIVDSGTLTAVTTITNPVTVTDGAGALNVIVDSSASIAVTGPLTDTQLRATAVPVSGTVTASGPLTDTQLRATPVPVSGAVTVSDGAGALNVIVDSSALPSGAATSALQDGIIKDGSGDTTQANVSSGRLQVDGSGVTQPVSGAVTVSDGAGALNVIVDSSASIAVTGPLTDAQLRATPVPVSGGGDGAIQDGASSSIEATVFDLTNSNPLAAQIVDGSGTAITSFGGGTQYTEGDTDASITGTAFLWEDTSDTLRAVSAAKPLPVSTGTVTITDGSGALNVIVDSSASIAVTGPLTDTQLRATAVPVSGTVTATGPLTDTELRATPVPVSGTVTVTDGAGALNTIVDSGTLTGITNAVTVTDGSGALNVIADSGTITTVSTVTSVTQNADVRQSTASNLNVQAVGSIASDTGDSGNPVKVGGKAFSYGTGPTDVTANDRVDAAYTRGGQAWTLVGSPASTSVEYLWTTAQTNDALISVSSGTRIVVTGYQIQVSGATTVLTAVRCGFATATLSTAPTDGNTATGTFVNVELVPGSGSNSPPGMLVAGADDEDVRCTTGATTTGTGHMFIFYYTTAN